MSSLLDRRPAPAAARPSPVLPRRRTRVLELPEARWALAALALFLLALPPYLLGAPAWLWGTLFAAVYVTGGWEPGLEGCRALGNRTLDVDLLMILAALGAAAIGQVLDGALLIVIFATSGALEAVATARTADSVRALLGLSPTTATRLLPDGTEESVEAARLEVGDTILVRPGERVGADGRVLDGAGDVDQATITGEPLPVAKEAGDEVFAGTLNGTGALRVRVGRAPADSVIARIVRMVEEASATKAPTQLFIERIEQRYSVGMVIATLAVFGVPLAFGEALQPALLRAMTFMIVASPCAVVLSTMPPLLSAIANAGRHGVLVKSAVVMERLGRTDTVAFDKTGTLTEGTPRVTDLRPLPGSGLDEEELLALAAAAEHPSEHALARAVVGAARERSLPLAPATGFTSTPGQGVSATVGGRTVRAGSPSRLLPEGADAARAAVRELEDAGRTAVVVLCDGEPAGVLGIADRLRSDAPAAVAALTRLTGRTPVLLTGDNERAARHLAAEVGITDVRAGLLPQDKVTAVREWEREGRKVLVIGDGVNDAPALAAAHTGIAMGGAGSDLALETADGVAVRDELATLPAVVGLSRTARRLVVQNLCIAGVFITALVAWDLIGTLPLPLGVAGHEGSTVIVGLNGLRLLRESAWTGPAEDAVRAAPTPGRPAPGGPGPVPPGG
ncbi:heavy metal translocating P-type ATPase [Streptomyces xinghaiensis]|uniref:Cadmium-translocating P-type ATPase n=1 Tax=Streptomyces xinghaiensis TaxID=1038928 RepID=A0A3M8ET55_9ACTN|nr:MULTISPECIES: heavy metal translocating P-type ATPase [Streptomyces]PQM19599.1 cadmium-translocating P-type ATPase [Streptomyces xinghaiensis]RKM90235.1 cadmium-translocating P-type ATPase [Streptomyces xinghaiensis]RNC69080.1 cadmium-translocating P-type ATPase [Streptomyces xinghaiensis]